MRAYARDGMVFCTTGDPNFSSQCHVKVGTQTFRLRRHGQDLPRGLVSELLNEVEFANWDLETAGPSPIQFGADLSNEWTLAGSVTYFIECDSNPPPFRLFAKTRSGGADIPIVQNLPLILRGYSACHRCAATICVAFYDAAGAVLRTDKFSLPFAKGGRRAADYYKTHERVVPPKRAEKANVFIIYDRAVDPVDDFNSFIFISRFSLSYLDWDMRPDAVAGRYNHHDNHASRHNHASEMNWYSARLDLYYLTENKSDVEVVSPTGAERILCYSELGLPAHAKIEHVDVNRLRLDIPEDIRYSIFLDGRRIDEDTFGIINHNEILLENEYLDGGHHELQLRDITGCYIMCGTWILLPFQQTPWKIMQEHGGTHPSELLSPAAGQRYRSLLSHVTATRHGRESTSTILLEQIEHLHSVLLKGFEHNRDFRRLAFPVHDQPEVSVIIPVHDKFEVTYFCLCALLYSYNEVPYEVVVVDDGSSDRTIALPEIVSDITYVRSDVARGFVHACNEGARHARGRYVAFLNNDTEPAFGWLDELLATFKIFPGVGLVGSKLLYPDGRLQDAGGIIWKSGNPWNYGRLENPFDPRFSYSREVDYLSGAAIMISQHLWCDVGGFSDEFAPAYFEDTDLAFKVRQAGFKAMLSATSIVYHFEGITGGTDVREGSVKRFQEVNRPKFKRKWRDAFRSYSQEGVSPDLEKDRGVVGRALFIDYATPRIDMDAGSYAAIQEMRLLQRLGYKVSFFPMNAAYLGDYFTALQRQGVEMLHAPFFTWVGEVLEKRGSDLDVVYITRYYVAQETIEIVRRHAPRAKILFCNADLHFLRALRSAVLKDDASKIAEATSIRDAELAVMRQVDVTLSYNEVEHAVILSHNLGVGRVMKLPWVEHVYEISHTFEQRDGLAFLGNFQHAPNVEAIEYFTTAVMPVIEERLGKVTFNVYGSNMPKKLEDLAGQSVVMHGHVRDVGEVFDNCKVFVAPLLSGAGIKGKVLSALARGVPSVLSSTAAEGIGLRHGRECLIADTPVGWAKAVASLMTDRALWERISEAGQALIRDEYSVAHGLKMMRDIIETLDLPIL